MKIIFTIFILLSVSFNSFTQTADHSYFAANGEVYFQFQITPQTDLNLLTRIISIDNVKDNIVYAYANEKEYNKFLSYSIEHTVLPKPGLVKEVKMSNNPDEITAWDTYPTYDAYVTMMTAYQTAHPDICKIIDGGTTVNGRHILFAKITQNVNVRNPKPQFMYTSSMHGDETTGYILMLRLIDTLLSSYGTDTRLTNMVNNVEIWINPLANPDGTYYGGNSTVNSAIRYNGNNIDLNRNFPDPQAGQHPDGLAWQPETIIMMNLIAANRFTLSANFHGGSQVFNYPWDTWAKLHPDDTWYEFIGKNFVDTVHAHSVSGYMTDLNNGITNGYAWYQVTGGRQDYMNYYGRGREVTIEICTTKLTPAAQLPNYWNYLYRSFLNFIENTYYGIRGTVKDASGNPIKALITVTSHDSENTQIYSDSLTGSFYRMIAPGTYSVTFAADSFVTKTVSSISVANYAASTYNVVLSPLHPTPVELTKFNSYVEDNKVILKWETATEINNKGFEIIRKYPADNSTQIVGFLNGYGSSAIKHNYNFIDKVNLAGKYEYFLNQIDINGTNNTVAETEANIVLNNYSLYQNYPNPFNPSTSIEFEVPKEDNVTIKLYDILGNDVMTLLSEIKKPGHYTLFLNAGNLASGMYIYKMQSGNFVSTKKLMLTK